MTRVKAIYKASDYPETPTGRPEGDLAELFGHLFAGSDKSELDKAHTGIAVAAQNPQLALGLAKLSRFIAVETSWCQRADLRELAIQTVNLVFKSDFSFQSRLPNAAAAGLRPELLAALPYWRTSSLFDEEQRLVIEYSHAVASGEVPDELFARVVAAYGEKGAVEFTALVGFWGFWAMFLNATSPRFE